MDINLTVSLTLMAVRLLLLYLPFPFTRQLYCSAQYSVLHPTYLNVYSIKPGNQNHQEEKFSLEVGWIFTWQFWPGDTILTTYPSIYCSDSLALSITTWSRNLETLTILQYSSMLEDVSSSVYRCIVGTEVDLVCYQTCNLRTEIKLCIIRSRIIPLMASSQLSLAYKLNGKNKI